ncbi:MAG: aldehyde dehydrogenase family protein, partial [Chryseotalea sp.]
IAFFKEKIKAIRLGNPLEEQTQMGPISKLEFVNKLRNQVEKATQQGARLVEGAQAKDNFFLPGILLADAEHSMHTEELFGPVLTLIPYQKEEGLLDLINNNPFGLAASVWSSNVEKAFSFSEKIEAGTVVINDFMKSDPRIPFGGIKLSGYGREMGKQGFISFLNEKVIIVPR